MQITQIQSAFIRVIREIRGQTAWDGGQKASLCVTASPSVPWFGCLDGQMKMIPHDDVGVQAPAEAAARFKNAALECTRRARRREEIVAIFAFSFCSRAGS